MCAGLLGVGDWTVDRNTRVLEMALSSGRFGIYILYRPQPMQSIHTHSLHREFEMVFGAKGNKADRAEARRAAAANRVAKAAAERAQSQEAEMPKEAEILQEERSATPPTPSAPSEDDEEIALLQQTEQQAEEIALLQAQLKILRTQAAAKQANEEEDASDDDDTEEALTKAVEAEKEALKKAEEALKKAADAEAKIKDLEDKVLAWERKDKAIMRVQAWSSEDAAVPAVPEGDDAQKKGGAQKKRGVQKKGGAGAKKKEGGGERGHKKVGAREDKRDALNKPGLLPGVTTIMFHRGNTPKQGNTIMGLMDAAVEKLEELKNDVTGGWAEAAKMDEVDLFALDAKAKLLHVQASEVFDKLRYIQDERSKVNPVNYLQGYIVRASALNDFAVMFLDAAEMTEDDNIDYLLDLWSQQESVFNKARIELVNFIQEGGRTCGENCPCDSECAQKNELRLNCLNVEHFITHGVLENVHTLLHEYMPDRGWKCIPKMHDFEFSDDSSAPVAKRRKADGKRSGGKAKEHLKMDSDDEPSGGMPNKAALDRETTPGRDPEDPRILPQRFGNPALTRGDGGIVRDGTGSSAPKTGRKKAQARKMTYSSADLDSTQYQGLPGGFFRN